MKSMNRKVQKIIVVTMLCMGIFWGTFINESKATNEIKEGTTSNQLSSVCIFGITKRNRK